MSPFYLDGQEYEPAGVQRAYAGGSGLMLFDRPAAPVLTPDFGPALVNDGGSVPSFVDGEWVNASTSLLVSSAAFEHTGDWTVEALVTPTGSLDTRTRYAIHGGSGTGGSSTVISLGILRATAGAKPAIQVGSLLYNYGAAPMPMDVESHLCVTKESGTARIFMNGALLTTVVGSGANPVWPAGFRLGGAQSYNSNNRWLGSINEIRISNFARYTAAFTPPTGELPADAGTLAAYHFNLPA